MFNQLLEGPVWWRYRQLKLENGWNEREKNTDEKETPGNGFDKQSKIAVLIMIALWLLFTISIAAASFYYGKSLACVPRISSPFVPYIPFTNKPIRFQQLKEWSGPSLESDALWDSIVNNSEHRFIRIFNPKEKGIPLGNTQLGDADGTKHGHIYSVGMHHQLHCLATIRQLVYNPSLIPSLPAISRLAVRNGDPSFYDWDHIGHCFPYLKQAITCAGDGTLEYPTPEKNLGQNGVDEWGVVHYECRNTKVLDDFIDKYVAF